MKKSKIILISVLLAAALLLSSCAKVSETAENSTASSAPADGQAAVIRIFETSDIHGYIMDTSSGEEETFQYRLAYIANLVNNARADDAYDDVLLLDSGDLYQGLPLSNLTFGAAIRAAMDAMRYDAVSLGNHEFDWSVTPYAADTKATVPAYEMGDFKGDPDIPVIAATLCSAETHERVSFTRDYVIAEKAGLRIALIGYIPDYSGDIMTEKIAPYEIRGDLSEFADRVREINEAEKPDATIVLAHEMPVTVAEALDPADVQLVAGGHVHDGIAGVADSGVAYIQPKEYAKGYACATMVIGADGSVRIEDPETVDIRDNPDLLYDTPGNADNLDSAVLEISRAAWEAVSDDMNETLGFIDTSVENRGVVSGKTTSGGNWVTGLMLRETASYGTVAAFYNTGGIRTSFTVPEGEEQRLITTGDVYAMLPFGNSWLVYEVTGKELARQIADGYVDQSFGDQMSGLTFTYENSGTAEEPDIKITGITLSDGTAVDVNDETKTYRVCTSNYNATVPGSVFENKEPLCPLSDAPIDNLSAIELLRQEAAENSGRIDVDTGGRDICVAGEAVGLAAQH